MRRLEVGDRVRYIRTDELDDYDLIGKFGTVVQVDDSSHHKYMCAVQFDGGNCVSWGAWRYELISHTHMHNPVFTLEEINAYSY
jgi:hypothetical protein